ncbi:hypothetical protein PENSPDRAFT_650943 [Peniophora sp. CONT]|nr:hypothetical protein PENSPDRAFT_650943 [Peniophora sp. CONT]
MAASYFTIWTSPALAFAIFGLFGLSAEARASYWHTLLIVGSWLGCKPTDMRNPQSTLGTMEFGARPQESSVDAETGSYPSRPSELEQAKKPAEESTASGPESEKIHRVSSDGDLADERDKLGAAKLADVSVLI